MTQILIKNLTKADIPALLKLIHELADYENASDRVTVTPEIIKHNFFAANNTAHACLMYDNETPIGYAIYYFTYSSYAGSKGLYIEDLYIQTACRGKKLGFQLMTHLAELAHENGCDHMKWAVLDWNLPSIDFYEKIGGKHTPEAKPYVLKGKDFVTLAKNKVT